MSLDTRETKGERGYGRSDVGTFTIANGADGSAVTPIDLTRNYLYLLIVCEDDQYIAATTNLSAEVTYDDGDTPVPLYELNDPSTQWSKGALPTAGNGFAFVLTHALGAQEIRLILSNNASGGSVVFKIYGIGAGVEKAGPDS
jgi:hypothetical protein